MLKHTTLAVGILITLLLVACSDTARPSQTNEVQTNTIPKTQISALIEQNGNLLIELPIGSNAGIDGATFLRVYDSHNNTSIKAMLKIQEVVDETHSIARLIGGLYDLSNPLQVGDPVHVVSDLSNYADDSELIEAVTERKEELELSAAEKEELFAGLRDQYQQRLWKLVQRYEDEIAELQMKQRKTLEQKQDNFSQQLTQAELQRRTDLAALRAALIEDSKQQITNLHINKDERYVNLRSERDELEDIIADLLREQALYKKSFERLQEENSMTEERLKQQLALEKEGRELLERKLMQLEGHMIESQRPDILLSYDAKSDETLLDRMERLERERRDTESLNNMLIEQADLLVVQLNGCNEKINKLEQTLATQEKALSNMEQSSKEAVQLSIDIEDTKKQRDAVLLARLESEKQLYELVVRVLRLQPDNPEQVRDLQNRLVLLLNSMGESESL